MNTYPLDHSAIVHLASMRKPYSNSFCLCVTLKETICPSVLQEAFAHTALRFPTIAAGIRRGFFSYRVVPAAESQGLPKVEEAREYLEYMPPEMLETCAMRVLYRENQIFAELGCAASALFLS